MIAFTKAKRVHCKVLNLNVAILLIMNKLCLADY